MTLALILLLGFGYLVVAIVFAVRQESLFFRQRRRLAATPATAGLDFEDLALSAADGVSVHAWWVPAPPLPSPSAQHPGRPFTLLFLHGANANLGDCVDDLRFWHDLGFGILAIDYRGYGRSGGRTSEAGLHRDVDAAWEWLTSRRNIPEGRILIVGVSMGVSLALTLAERQRPAGLVLEAGFTRAADVAARRYWWLPVRQLIRLQLAAEDVIGSVRSPKLLIHSVDDRTAPITLGRKLQQRAAPPCQFLKIRGAHGRARVEGGPRYRENLRRWLEKLETSDGAA